MDYNQKAREQAVEAVEYFEDDIKESLDDFNPRKDIYGPSNGDSYHHENHVDMAYDLQEAAELMDDLSEYVETDSGLWDGLDPRDAISAQAAYTYGNAVAHCYEQIVESIFDVYSDIESACIDLDYDDCLDLAKELAFKQGLEAWKDNNI